MSTSAPTDTSPTVPVQYFCDQAEFETKIAIFFDWDDTCAASTYLQGKGHSLNPALDRPLSVDDMMDVYGLSQHLVTMLSLALHYAGPNVYIVTNSQTNYVQMSSAKWMPAVSPLLDKIKVISARDLHEKEHPLTNDPVKDRQTQIIWKNLVFYNELCALFADPKPTRKHVLSFGDSHVEREAFLNAGRQLEEPRYVKSVKFVDLPTPKQLIKQIELICKCMNYLVKHIQDLDLQLTIKDESAPAPTPAPTSCATEERAPMDTEPKENEPIVA